MFRTAGFLSVADVECARVGGVSHIFPEKKGVSFTFLKKMHENAIFSLIRGRGRTPATPYAGPATACYIIGTHSNNVLLWFTKRILGTDFLWPFPCVPNDYHSHLLKNDNTHRSSFLSSHSL